MSSKSDNPRPLRWHRIETADPGATRSFQWSSAGPGKANIWAGAPIARRPGFALRLGGPCLSSSSNSLECSRESFRPIDSSGINGMNSGSIWQPPINDDALTSPFTATRSRAWIIVSASMIAAPRSPNESIQSPDQPAPRGFELIGVRKAQLAAVPSGLLENLSQGPRWASHLADSGRPMIVLVASRDPCVATGTGRAKFGLAITTAAPGRWLSNMPDMQQPRQPTGRRGRGELP